METYNFRGDLNFDLLGADGRKDDVFSMVVIEEHVAFLGVSVEFEGFDKLSADITLWTYANGFTFHRAYKKEIPNLIKDAEKIKKTILKQRRKLFKDARANTNNINNKVMVFKRNKYKYITFSSGDHVKRNYETTQKKRFGMVNKTALW